MAEKITVKTVLDPVRTPGGSEVLPFLDTNGLRYGVWEADFKPHILAGATLDVDVKQTTKPGNDGQTYVNRNITQIYIDGQPVKQRGGRGGGASPQQIASEEKRTAVSQILSTGKELMSEEQKSRVRQLVDKALDWCDTTLESGPAPAPPRPAPPTRPRVEPSGPPQSKDDHWQQLGRDRDKEEKPVFENRGQFFSKAYKDYDLSQSEVLNILGLTQASELNLEDLDASWEKVVAAVSKSKKK